MASWGLLEAASGYSYDASSDAIGFAPVISADGFRAPFVARDGWGRFAQTEDDGRLEARLRVSAGTLTVARIRLRPATARGTSVVTVDGRDVPSRLDVSDGGATVLLDGSVAINPGQVLEVVLVN